ncbi:hypothetical protein PMAYCL1PPCAC_29046, partial [Pristionchus mayeri]
RSRGMRRVCRVAMQLRLSSIRSLFVAGPSRPMSNQQQVRNEATTLSEKDEKLIHRGEFYGIVPTAPKRTEISSPELALSRMHEHLLRNYRVNPERVMIDLVLKLESGDADLISLLNRSPDRWIPMAIECCGRALSTISMGSRREIMRRLWKQIKERNLPLSIESINVLLRVRLENNEEWCPWETLTSIEEELRLVPDKETFHLLLEKLSLSGAPDECEKMMSYEMTFRGHSPSDPITHSHLVYANAVRGHNQKVDSMIQNASTKFGMEGEMLSLGRACIAAAAGGRTDRLRELMRRSLDEKKQLQLPMEDIFEIIWTLSEKEADRETKHEAFIEEILARSSHPNGFFRYQFREIERHISSAHFRTAILLMQQTTKVGDALRNQARIAFAEQMVAKICRAMIRSRTEKGQMMEMANRMETTLRLRSRFIHDELMMAVLTMKDSEMDDRLSTFSTLLPVVDPKKERPHIILPMLAICSNAEDRLRLLFRASALGYSNLEDLDSNLMAEYLFQPMYKHQAYLERQKNGVGKSAMERMAGILNSFGVPMESVWRMMHGWWKLKNETAMTMREKPSPHTIQTWLRSEYSSIFTDRAKEAMPSLSLSKSRLENAIEKGESSSLLSLLSSHGWPADATLSSTAPRVLEVLLKSTEDNAKISQWLSELSREAECRRERGEEEKSPLETHHLLKVINHRVKVNRLSAKELIEMVFELKRLFPLAIVNYDSTPNAVHETNILISNCFIFKEGTSLTMEVVEDITELLRTLMKLEMVALSQHGETVSMHCVHKVLQRFGWNSARKLWMQFQSTFAFGNGMLVLLSHLLKDDMAKAKEAIQFVLHKAHMSVPPSRIHSYYTAMLLNRKKMEEAEEYFRLNGSEMLPFDCFLAYKHTNALKYPPMSNDFIRSFPALCLAHTPLAEKTEEARNMLHTSLKYCELKRKGPLIVEICDLFARYGVEPDVNEKGRVENAMNDHQRLVNRWIFYPNGLIQAKADDEFIKEGEWKKMVISTQIDNSHRI